MWFVCVIIIICVIVPLSTANIFNIFMSNAEVQNYTMTSAATGKEIKWQIPWNESCLTFEVKIPHCGQYCACVQRNVNGDWECPDLWTSLLKNSIWGGYKNLESSNESAIVILGKIKTNGGTQYIRSSVRHINQSHSKQKRKKVNSIAISNAGKFVWSKWVYGWSIWHGFVMLVVVWFAICLCCACCACQKSESEESVVSTVSKV